MLGLRNSRLFPNSNRARQAKDQVDRAQRILERMGREVRYPNEGTARQIASQARQLGSALQAVMGQVPIERELIQMAQNLEGLATAQQNSFVSRVLGSLGTPGSLIQSWLRGREGQQSLRPIAEEIQRASQLVSQFSSILSGEVTPEQAGGVRRETPLLPAGSGGGSGNAGGQNRLPGGGGRGNGSGGSGGGSGGSGGGGGGTVASSPNPSPHPNVTILPDGRWHIRAPGYNRILQPDDPVLTGQMIRVASSNVYGIGYEFNFDQPLKGNLIVRYRQRDQNNRRATRGGPTYEYRAVHPDWFQNLRDVGSKGRWVWDHLRIRGTVAGHQYEYSLTRIAQGYVPRRAIVQNGVQRLIRRTRTAVLPNGQQAVFRSALPDQVIGRYTPGAHQPNYGNRDPGRGRVERPLFR